MKYLIILLSVLATVFFMESCRKKDKYVYVTGHILADSTVGMLALSNTGCNVYRTSAEDNITASVAGFYTDKDGHFNFKMRRARSGMVIIAPEAPYTNDTFYLSHDQDKYDAGTIIVKPIR